MEWKDIDVQQYRRGKESGWNAAQTMREALRNGIGEMHAIRLVRELYGIGLIEAKDLMVRATSGVSLDEHQDRLLDPLRKAVAEHDDDEESDS